MASSAGQEKLSLETLRSELAADPYRFDFFQSVRLLEAASEDLPRVGSSLSLTADMIRFCQSASLSFAPSTIEKFEPRVGRASRMTVHFLGLLGPNGPLPAHITEYARDRQLNHQDPTLVEFLNVFVHRFLSLFYRAWAVNQKAADFDRPAESNFARYIGSMFGLGVETLQNRENVSDTAKLYFSGRLAPANRNAEGLAAILSDYFQMPVLVDPFVGRWIDLPEESQLRLGESPMSGSLGQTTCVGSRIWDCQLGFRLRFGPMTLSQLQALLPETASFQRLKTWVKFYIGEEFFWDVQLVLKASEVPRTTLGGGTRLGWTSWLRDLPFPHDADSVILRA